MATLQQMRDYGAQITFYCAAGPALCTHSWEPSWDNLIQYFGPDADFSKDRSTFSRLVCEACGHRGATIIVQPPDNTPGMQGGYGHNHGTPNPIDTARLRAAHKIDTDIAAVKREHARRLHQEAKALKKQQKAYESGALVIGPPDPRAGRGRLK